jgi:ubiquitin
MPPNLNANAAATEKKPKDKVKKVNDKWVVSDYRADVLLTVGKVKKQDLVDTLQALDALEE